MSVSLCVCVCVGRKEVATEARMGKSSHRQSKKINANQGSKKNVSVWNGGLGPEYSGSLNTNTVSILICDQVQEEGLYNATHVGSLPVEILSG